MNKIDKKVIENIKELSKAMDLNNLSEIDISDGKSTYRLKRSNVQQTLNEYVEKAPNKISKKIEVHNEKDSSLKSPLVGTAYLCPEPGAKVFIEVGQNVKIGQVLLIIEAMKTMNEITADRNGVVKKNFYTKRNSC